MTAVATPDAARLVFAAVAGLILLLILIIKFKVHAMISILIGAVGIGLMAGMPLSDIIGSVNEGIGNTLKGIALLVGLAPCSVPFWKIRRRTDAGRDHGAQVRRRKSRMGAGYHRSGGGHAGVL